MTNMHVLLHQKLFKVDYKKRIVYLLSLYMNELYKINTIIFNGTTGKFYKTSIKD